MKVTELKKMLNEVDDISVSKKVISEVYQLVSNDKKREADLLIKKIIKENVKKKDNQEEDPFKTLSEEINSFLENACAGNYYSSNKVISKSDRYNWVSIFKGYLNKLDEITPDSKDYREVVDLYFKLYQLICNACRYRIFITDDESIFDCLGICQSDLYKKLVKKVLDVDYTDIDVCNLAILASTGGLNYDSLYDDQQAVLVSLFKTKDNINKIIKETAGFMKTLNDKLDTVDYLSNIYFALQCDINSFNNLLFMCRLKLKEYDKAINEYFENSKERDEEVTLYCALEITNWFTKNEKLWLQYYEYGINEKKIEPRDTLVEKYKELKKKLKH